MEDVLLKPVELESKDSPAVLDVLVLSFEYLLAGVCSEYSRINGISSIEEFNRKNSFNLTTLLSYPFFISLANGHSESLYKLFGEFHAFNFGPISISIYNELRGKAGKAPERKLRNFSLDLTGRASDFKAISMLNFNEIQESICKTNIKVNEKTVFFEEVFIRSESGRSNPIVLAIDSAIAAIKRQSKDTFFDGDPFSILFQANYFDSFRRAVSANDHRKIDYRDIEKPERRPFYAKELVH